VHPFGQTAKVRRYFPLFGLLDDTGKEGQQAGVPLGDAAAVETDVTDSRVAGDLPAEFVDGGNPPSSVQPPASCISRQSAAGRL